MKIALIDPGSKKLLFKENFPHIGLAYIAACLEKLGHEIHCLDLGLVGQKKTKQFLKGKFDVIGLPATSFTLSEVLALAKKIKSNHNDAIIVLGGPHVSIGMEDCLESPYIDFAVYGEGEKTMAELTEVISSESDSDIKQFSSIKGLIYRDRKRVICNPPRPRLDDLDNLPFPAFHYFSMNNYGMYPIFTSRGCPFSCSFCSIKAIWGKHWNYRSAKKIVQEIKYAREKYSLENKPFNIVDDSFNAIPDRVLEFCERIIADGLNIQWFSSGFRADRVPLKLAYKMKESGCIGVSVGIESSNNEVLAKIKKQETIDQITKGCNNLTRAGIPVQAQFMIGNPGDTYKTVKASIEYAKRQKFSDVAFYLALPYPKTELWEYVRNFGTFIKEDFTKFHHFSDEPVFETPEFPAKDRIKAYRQARKLALKTKIKQEFRTKIERLKHMDFSGLNFRRVLKAIARITKYTTDLAFDKKEKV
jgi:radical SAM superfamily enzyme YgiQ (UPF0313 family)